MDVKIRYVLRNGIHGHVKIGKSNPEALYSISGVALASEECHLVLPRHDQQMVENPAPNIPSKWSMGKIDMVHYLGMAKASIHQLSYMHDYI